jgi:hypothetical protein
VSTISNYYSNYYVSYSDVYALPVCAWDDNSYAYVDVGCGDDGSFVLAKFEDQYCQTPTGGISNTLDSLNKKIKKLANVCESAYDAGDNFVLGDLLQYLESCSPLDNVMCGDDNGSKMATYKSNSSGHSLSSDMSSQLASSLN